MLKLHPEFRIETSLSPRLPLLHTFGSLYKRWERSTCPQRQAFVRFYTRQIQPFVESDYNQLVD